LKLGVRCFIFDFDGTLAPNLDLPELRRRIAAMALARGVPEHVFAGRYIIETVDAAHAWLHAGGDRAADDYRDEAHRFITDFELAAASHLEPFPQVRDLLGSLRRRQRLSAVVTRNCEQAVRNTFPDIDAHVDVLLARDNVPHCKPDPRHVEHALRALDSRPEDAAMVGDGRMDMSLGRSLGLLCVGVLTGSSDRQALLEAGADLVVDHVAQLAALL